MSTWTGRPPDSLASLKVLIGPIKGIITSGTAAVFVVLLVFDGIKPPNTNDIDISAFSIRASLKLLLYCLYFTVTTLSTTGYGDVYAQNTSGRVVCIILQLASFFLVTFVLALFWSVRPPENERT